MTNQGATILLINAKKESAGCRLRWLILEEVCREEKIKPLATEYLEITTTISKKTKRRTRLSLAPGIMVIQIIKIAIRLLTSREIKSVATGKPSSRTLLTVLLICKALGKLVIVDICDLDQNNKYTIAMLRVADIVTTPTRQLADKIRYYRDGDIIIVSDQLDYTCAPDKNATTNDQTLDLLWFGNLEKKGKITRESFTAFCSVVKKSAPFLAQNNISITIVSQRAEDAREHILDAIGNASIQCESLEWSPKTMRSALSKKGFALLPYEEPIKNCAKSPNRIELALYSGKVVLSNGYLPSLDAELRKYVTVYNNNQLDESILKIPNRSKDEAAQARFAIEKKQAQIKQKWKDITKAIISS